MASNWERGLFDEWKAFSRNMNFYFFSCPVFSDQRSKNKVVFYAQGWVEGWPNLKEKWRLSMAKIFYKHKWCSKPKLNNQNYNCTSISISFNTSNAWTTVISLKDQNQIWKAVFELLAFKFQEISWIAVWKRQEKNIVFVKCKHQISGGNIINCFVFCIFLSSN